MDSLLRTKAGVLTWAAFVASVGGEGVIMVSRPLNCIPDQRVLLETGSDVVCAMMSHQRKAPIFSFNQGVCSLCGEGQDGSNPKGFAPFSPPTFTRVDNVAQGKPVEAATYHSSSYYPEYGNDASNASTYINHHSATLPWWMVDLNDAHLVDRVEVLTWQAPWTYRFSQIEVRVGAETRTGSDFSGWPLLDTYEGPYTLGDGYVVFANETKLCGRYVVIQRVNPVADYLEIADVKVFVHLP